MRKTWIVVVAVVVVLVALAYVGSPYLAARDFVAAAKAGETDKLEAAVDFPAVRASLKTQLTAAVTARLQNDPAMRGNPFAGLGTMLMPSILNRMVDSVVTADSIAALARAGRIVHVGSASAQAQASEHDLHYLSLNRFEVTVRRKDQPGDPTNLVFERRGLFGWKLVRIELPQDALTPSDDLPSTIPPPPPEDDTPDTGSPLDQQRDDGPVNAAASSTI